MLASVKMKVVEPAGYAPASAGCKAAVLLLNEGPLKMARRPGDAPGWRSFGDSAAQAGARRVNENGAVSRSCTGVPGLAYRNPAAER
jgi:hypothetical protein